MPGWHGKYEKGKKEKGGKKTEKPPREGPQQVPGVCNINREHINKRRRSTSQGRASASAGWAPGGSSASIACLV